MCVCVCMYITVCVITDISFVCVCMLMSVCVCVDSTYLLARIPNAFSAVRLALLSR